jgi:hypothetical protein
MSLLLLLLLLLLLGCHCSWATFHICLTTWRTTPPQGAAWTCSASAQLDTAEAASWRHCTLQVASVCLADQVFFSVHCFTRAVCALRQRRASFWNVAVQRGVPSDA